MDDSDTDHGTSSVPTVAIVGELNVDLILEQVNALPELEKERIAEGMTFTMGSSSAILAANAGALGMLVGFVGRVGHDTFGAYMRDHLAQRGVDTQHILETPDVATGLTVIFTYGDQRGMLTYPGAMNELTIDDLPWDYLEEVQHVHLSSYYMQPGLRPDCPELFRQAKGLGLTTSLDTNWDPADEWGRDVLDVLEYIDVFLPNDEEARLISGESDLDQAIEFLARQVEIVVTTCGADGVRAQRGTETFSLPALPVTPADAVGAGDSFNAGFLKQFVAGEPLEKCLRYGMLTGAFSTQAPGGTAAFNDMEAFDAFIRSNRQYLGTDTTPQNAATHHGEDRQ
jgi:sugar/nucleoside kinase (ribokinase family)